MKYVILVRSHYCSYIDVVSCSILPGKGNGGDVMFPVASRSASRCTYNVSLESKQWAWSPTMSIKPFRSLLNISTSAFKSLFLNSLLRASSTRSSCSLFCLFLHLLAALRFFSRYNARAELGVEESVLHLRPALRFSVVAGYVPWLLCRLSL
jgi:hypothetical protein